MAFIRCKGVALIHVVATDFSLLKKNVVRALRAVGSEHISLT